MLRSICSLRMPWILVCTLLCLHSGCTKLLTQQAVNRFSQSLEDKDYTDLKLAVSNRFEERALRREEAVRDLAILAIPTGETKIIDIEQVSKNEVRAKVEVKIGKDNAARDVVYTLTRDPKIQRWVVDDVTLKQDSGRGEVTRSAIEQLDLVMSVRDFVDAWHSGDREKILAVTSPELREPLEQLPPAWLTQLAAHVAEQTPQQKSLRPDARLKDDKAVVGVGRVLVEFQLIDGHWFVRDAALEDQADTVRSALKLAIALRQTQGFLEAYAAGDKDRLAKNASSEFHQGCLVAADLAQVPVPTTELFAKPYEARQQKDHLDIVLKSEKGAVLVSLDTKSATGSATPEKTAVPLVSEVTLVEDGSREAKRLTSLFLAETMVQLYAEALIVRDVKRLQSMSTRDFNERVWSRVRPDILQSLPMPEIETATPEILNVSYSGAKTEVTVSQGTRALTYVLHATPGRMEVEDVLMPVENRPASLKTNVEHLIPVYEFIAGIAGNNVDRVRQCSAESFNSMIWEQLSEIPEMKVDPVRLLTLPLTGMRISDTMARLQFGNATQGAEVAISRENGEMRVHDMVLITGTTPRDRIELLATMRRMITGGLSSDGKILQAKAESPGSPRPKASQRIQQAIQIE